MRKLKLNVEALAVESFTPSKEQTEAGTVRGYLSAYYQLCYEGDSWQQSCTCEPTCNADTCYQCPTPACPTGGCPATNNRAACTETCNPIYG